MLELVKQILNITLFDKAESRLAIIADFGADEGRQLPPDDCKVTVGPNGPEFLTTLRDWLAVESPERLFLLPPLVPRKELSTDLRQKFRSLDLHEIALKIALEKMPAGSLLGILMPHGFLLNRKNSDFREELNKAATPRFVIDLAGDRLFPDFMVQFHLLIFEIGETNDRIVRFFRCPEIPITSDEAGVQRPDDQRQQAILADLRRLKKQGGGETEFGYVLREGIPAGTPWLFDRHHPRYQQRLADLGHFGEVTPLGEIADMWLGLNPTTQLDYIIPGRETGRGIAMIGGRDIGPDNSLNYRDTQLRVLPKVGDSHLLQSNDICLRSIVGPNQNLKAVKIEAGMLPLAASASVVILRPKPDVDVDIDFLVAYLQSDHVIEILRAQGIAHQLYVSALADLPVPLPDNELDTVLQDLRTAAQTMGQWQTEAESAIQGLFGYESMRDARLETLAAGRRIRQRERAGRQVDNLSYRLRTGLPYPLAFRWRMAETAQANLEGYRDVLECAETVICYLGLVSLVLMRAVDEPVGYVGPMSERLTNKGHGTSFGDWVAILREVQGRKALKNMPSVSFYEAARFLDDEAVNQALKLLTDNRNDNAHGRGPKGSEVREKVEESRQALQTLLEAVEFLTEYPLRYIEKTQRDTIAGTTSYRYRTMMGDHPLVGLAETQTEVAELEAGSLYLVDRTGDLYLIRPYLVRQECPRCKNLEIFYLDTFKAREGLCVLKSMTSGHTMEDDQIARVFRHVGLVR